jgi:hypothetical protein
MLAKITNKDAKYFLEPSAGKGDIADAIRNPCTYEEFVPTIPNMQNSGRVIVATLRGATETGTAVYTSM